MKTFLLLLALALPASARIGERLAECVAQYGEPQNKEGDLRLFHKAGLIIAIQFYDGKAGVIAFRKDAGKMTITESDALIDANAVADFHCAIIV